ncbi:hypothetical protein EJ04DRAFT_525603 [Polyplosphaeria fusca]|uniref:Siderophore biosynthesis n=1 Tax=Polyplosphaeria fusca TaxID=682080 RepID=A0A9P4QSW1_9PLEO|nr:hypothetical protein EJ04DRAFT_525603 [Polyplosphaeria fusca]
MYTSTLAATLALAAFAAAKTDLAGCTSTLAGNTYTYYVPETGEICELLDCGGGRAPAKTTVPGCAAYAGTETYQPSYLSIAAAASSYYSEGAVPTSEAVVTSESAVVETSSAAASAVESTLATLTNVPLVTGTGSPSGTVVAPGGNNVTSTATLSTTGSPSLPAGTGAANAGAVVGRGVVVLAGVVGLAVL